MFSDEKRAEIGRYAAENGNNAALEKFRRDIPDLGKSIPGVYRALAITSRNDVTFTSVWQKRAFRIITNLQMAQQQPFSSYYYKLDAQLKARYLEKVSLIKQEDPYALKKADFCRNTTHLPSLG